jgi:Na+/phosphate symporter
MKQQVVKTPKLKIAVVIMSILTGVALLGISIALFIVTVLPRGLRDYPSMIPLVVSIIIIGIITIVLGFLFRKNNKSVPLLINVALPIIVSFIFTVVWFVYGATVSPPFATQMFFSTLFALIVLFLPLNVVTTILLIIYLVKNKKDKKKPKPVPTPPQK